MKATSISSLLSAASGVFYACCGVFVKLLKGKCDAFTIFTARSVVILTFSIAILLAKRTKFWSHGWKDVLVITATTVVSLTASILQYKSYQLISLANAFTITSSTPIFIAMLSLICHRKICSLLETGLVMLCIIGVVMCAQPEFIFKHMDNNSRPDTLGVIMVVIAAFGRAIVFMGYKKAGKVDVPSMLFFQFSSTIVFMAVIYPLTGFHPLPGNLIDGIYVLMAGFFSFLAISTLCLSVIYGDPQLAAIGRNTDIIASIIFDAILFHSTINWMSIIGSVLVITSILLPPIISLYTKQKDNAAQNTTQMH